MATFTEDINPKATKSQLKTLVRSLNVLLNNVNLPYLSIRLCQELVKLRSAARLKLNGSK